MDECLPGSTFRARQLPIEIFPSITKYLRDEDCVALALSGEVKGFAAFYRDDRYI